MTTEIAPGESLVDLYARLAMVDYAETEDATISLGVDRQSLEDDKLAAERQLGEHLIPYIGKGIVLRQITDGAPLIFSRLHSRFVREAHGRLSQRTLRPPYRYIFFDSFLWHIQTAAGSYAPVIDFETLEPLVEVELTN